MSITKKILALVAVLVAFTAITAFGYHQLVSRVRDMATERTTEMLLQDYRNELKDLVDAMAASLGAAAEGVSDERELYRKLNGLVQGARFFPDNSGYYFIYKAGGTVFVLPTVRDLEGKNIIERVDAKGTPFIRKLDQVASMGGGYVEYWFDKPGQGVLPKISYARMIPGTGLWVGTGVYVDDVESRQNRILKDIHDTATSYLWKLYLAVVNGFLVIVIPLVVFLVVSIVRPLKQLTAVADSYSQGELDLKIPGLGRRDEIGNLAKALARLGTSMRKAMQILKISA